MAKTTLYEVRGADIWTKDFGRVAVGDAVELEPDEARHFNKLGYLAPHIPDDEATEEAIGEPLLPLAEPEKTRAPARR